MKLSNKARRFIAFAEFCERNLIPAFDAAELVTLANRVFNAGERGDASKEWVRFDKKATELGYETLSYGLWPCLRKDGKDIEIPPFE
jgi:hypothetical protein